MNDMRPFINRVKSISLCCAATATLVACTSSAPMIHRDNVAQMYGRGSGAIRLHARVYHEDAERSIIHYKVNTADLLYKSDGSGPFKAQARLTYATYSSPEARQLRDSASTLLTDRMDGPAEERELIGAMELRREPGEAFTIVVTVRDLHREGEGKVMIQVADDAAARTQYYMTIDPANGLPLFTDHVPSGMPVSVRCERCAGDSIRIARYPMPPSLPSPVFSGEPRGRADPASDSAFTALANENGRIDLGVLPTGSYQLVSPGDSAGYAVHVLEQAYPYVDHPRALLPPLRFITSTQEFERLSKAEDTRKAVERFWLDATGDRERAREAIRIYYERVENANRHFSAGIEGWRTDRGLVHIVFGTPTSIYRTAQGETWTYGEENNLMSLTFNFTRRRSALTGNDYTLQRDPMLKGAWYRNVESWRNGRIYQN
jgi:GWxTD domain-containing protein